MEFLKELAEMFVRPDEASEPATRSSCSCGGGSGGSSSISPTDFLYARDTLFPAANGKQKASSQMYGDIGSMNFDSGISASYTPPTNYLHEMWHKQAEEQQKHREGEERRMRRDAEVESRAYMEWNRRGRGGSPIMLWDRDDY